MDVICQGDTKICSRIMDEFGDWSVLVIVSDKDVVVDSPYMRVEFKHNGDVDVVVRLLRMARLMYGAVQLVGNTVEAGRCMESGEALHST